MFFSKLKKTDNEILPPPPPFPGMEFNEAEFGKGPENEPAVNAQENSYVKEEENSSDEQIKEDFDKVLETVSEKSQKRAKLSKVGKKPKAISKKEIQIDEIKAEVPEVEETLLTNDVSQTNAAPYISTNAERIDPGPTAQFSVTSEAIEDFRMQHLEEAREEIRNAILMMQRKDRPSFLKALFSRNTKDSIQVSNIDMISRKISEAQQSLSRNDTMNAKTIYMDIMRLYNKCDNTEKSRIYNDIRVLYDSRKKAEQLIAL